MSLQCVACKQFINRFYTNMYTTSQQVEMNVSVHPVFTNGIRNIVIINPQPLRIVVNG